MCSSVIPNTDTQHKNLSLFVYETSTYLFCLIKYTSKSSWNLNWGSTVAFVCWTLIKWFITLARILAWCSWARHFDTLTVPSNLKDRLASDRQNAATCNKMASGLWGVAKLLALHATEIKAKHWESWARWDQEALLYPSEVLPGLPVYEPRSCWWGVAIFLSCSNPFNSNRFQPWLKLCKALHSISWRKLMLKMNDISPNKWTISSFNRWIKFHDCINS